MDAFPPNKRRPNEEITVVRIDDDRYPPLLRHIAQPPVLLYVRGSVSALSHPCPIAFVGTRKMTAYGATAVRLLVGPTARAGACIVSGLALGIDAAVHEATLYEGGVTIAVLAGGVDDASIGPKSNLGLARRIIATGGALISEVPPGTNAAKFGFPRRNRIVAGMCRGTVAVEAARKSGALITAYLALDANRDVYAVPGPITAPSSVGVNDLLLHGATPLLEATQIMNAYGLTATAFDPQTLVDERERVIYERLVRAPKTADALSEETGFSMREILAVTTALTLKNLISEDRGVFIKN